MFGQAVRPAHAPEPAGLTEGAFAWAEILGQEPRIPFAVREGMTMDVWRRHGDAFVAARWRLPVPRASVPTGT